MTACAEASGTSALVAVTVIDPVNAPGAVGDQAEVIKPALVDQTTPPGAPATVADNCALVPATRLGGAPEMPTATVLPASVAVASAGVSG